MQVVRRTEDTTHMRTHTYAGTHIKGIIDRIC